MNTLPATDNRTFLRALAATAMAVPALLVVAASFLPDGLARGELLVSGHEALAALLAGALLVRAAYALGFRRALKALRFAEPLEAAAA